MNIGEQTIEWLYREQLKVDDEWAIRTPTGFKWWADKHAQTVEVVGEEPGPDGDIGYLISVRTGFLCDLEMTDRHSVLINRLLMPFAAMSGPVYDAAARTLDLCSLVRVHSDISPWMNPLVSVAAVLQIGEVRIMSSSTADLLHAKDAASGHPEHGMRPRPDEMAEVIETLIGPMGQLPCRWTVAEFENTVAEYMQHPPSLDANAGGLRCTVEFPFGDQSSLCQMMGDQPHPKYGNGLLLLQSFPVGVMADAEGARLALSLNATELTEQPSGYGLGSYEYSDGSVHFTSFLPNAVYRAGLLQNCYFSSAWRARAMSIRLTNCDWNSESFSVRRSAMGRILDRIRGR